MKSLFRLAASCPSYQLLADQGEGWLEKPVRYLL